MNLYILCILLVFLFKNSNTAPANEKSLSLYTSEDDVEVLTSDNFKKQIDSSSSAWLVVFYLHWCGECQRFAPSWKELALDIYAWRDLVKIGAIDCANEKNTPLCNEYIQGHYPAVRYFHENYKTGPGHYGMDFSKTPNDFDSHRHHLIDRIISEINEGRGARYPYLIPYNHADFSHLFEKLPDTINYVFLVVEPPHTYLGAEVALDLHKTPDIFIRHSLTNNSALVANLLVEKFPRAMVVDRNNNPQILPGQITTRKQLKEAIGEFLTTKGMQIVENHSPKKPSSNLTAKSKDTPRTILRKRIKKMGDVVFQMDLETALRYSLKQEISLYKIVQDEKLNALKAYLGVVEKYFPFSPNTSFIQEIKQLTQVGEVEGWKIGEIIRSAEDQGVFSSPQRFLACEGSSPLYRGYPCSLWKLFHYLTVNSALENSDNKSVNAREILDAIYGYIKYFFGCEHCSQHFEDLASEKDISNVSSLDAAILWLWEAHNEVNKRLAGDKTEDPEYPKVQFPTKESCPGCIKEDGSWDKNEVLRYLKRIYSNLNVRYIGSDTTVLFPGLN